MSMTYQRKIEDMQVTIHNLMKQNDRLRKERDAAVEDIRMLGRMGLNICPVCACHNHGEGDKQKCVTCIINNDTDNFQWRGEG